MAEERPLPVTDHLSTHDLLGVLSTERDARRQWRILEPNLMKGRPERTYPLILNYAELIAEQTREWPAARLRVAFAHQPSVVLFALMRPWSNNQVLAVAQENAEENRIIQWLREREIDRLLKLKTTHEPTSASDAREILRVDKNADEAAVKKTWRILLGALHADLGRSQERPIHRKKDEIAKHLQAARNVLLKSL